MNRTRLIVGGVLFFSLAANIAMGTTLYQKSKVTVMDYSVYESFSTSLNGAIQSVDKASRDTGTMRTEDVLHVNSNLERAVGILMGLRSEGPSHGLHFGPLQFALLKSELPSPNDPAFANQEDSLIRKSSATLHLIQSGLKGTTYQNDGELIKLRFAVNAVDSKLPPA